MPNKPLDREPIREYAEKILEAVPKDAIEGVDQKFSLKELHLIAEMVGVSTSGTKKEIIRRLLAREFMIKSKDEVFRLFDEYKERLRE